MRKSALVLISSFFFPAAFAQSYVEPYNKLKTYMQSVKQLYVTNMEIKDNYLFIYRPGDDYYKINLKNLGPAVANTKKKWVKMECLNYAKCEYSSISKSKSSMVMFLDHDDGVCEKLPALLNDFISAYDKDFGITYVPPDIGNKAEDESNYVGEFLYADNSTGSLNCKDPATVRVYGIGNSSIKINDAKDTLSNTEKLNWLQNSALAFSSNEKELYFRHPTDNYYQVWNVASKQKMAEIPFSEAGNTAAGRMVSSSFPNTVYPKDTYLNTKIWISEDLNISFDKNEQFTVTSIQDLRQQKFFIFPRGYAFESNFIDYEKFVKKVPLTNIKYSFIFHKKSDKLFIIITGDQITKEKNYYPYCGVYRYNLTTGKSDELTENIQCECVSGSTYKYRWFFSTNTLVNFYVQHPDMTLQQFGLDSLSKKHLKYATQTPNMVFSDYEPTGWYMQYIGSDNAGNPYLCKPLNNAILIKKHQINGKCTWETVVNIRHSTNRRNTVKQQQDETLNVMAVSPSGKLFAYLNLHHIPDSGNIASIMLYDDAEKDRVYTFNDQTRYSAIIAKNYITNKESEELALTWEKQINTAKDKRLALYKGRVDSIKAKIAEAEKALVATYEKDIDLIKQRKYAEVLKGKKWNGYKEYLSTMTYAGQNGSPDRTVTALFKIQEELEFIKRGENIDVKMIETLTLPRGKVDEYGRLILKDKDLSDKTALEYGYSSYKYITSTCSAPLSGFKWPEFRLGNTPYIGCSDPFGSIKGVEVINDSKYYKMFTDQYMNFLWKCNFKFFLSEGSLKITLLATGNEGTVIGLDYEKTDAQSQIEDRKNTLVKQLNDLQKFIEKGN